MLEEVTPVAKRAVVHSELYQVPIKRKDLEEIMVEEQLVTNKYEAGTEPCGVQIDQYTTYICFP